MPETFQPPGARGPRIEAPTQFTVFKREFAKLLIKGNRFPLRNIFGDIGIPDSAREEMFGKSGEPITEDQIGTVLRLLGSFKDKELLKGFFATFLEVGKSLKEDIIAEIRRAKKP